jgi:insecticidal toxin complex protein TccC
MSTSLYSNTPAVTALDNRGLLVRVIAYYRHPSSPDITSERITHHQYDARGFLTQSADPRLNDVDCENFNYISGLSGSVLRTVSVDAGTTVALGDAAGRPFIAVSNLSTNDDGTEDQSQAMTRTWQYEDVTLPGRPLSITEQVGDEAARISERFVYADDTDEDRALSLAGRCISHYDTAGLMQTDSVALTGVPLSVTRRLLKEADSPETVADWQGEDTSAWDKLLVEESEGHTTLTTTDASGAVLTTTDAKGNLQRVAYDVAGQLSGSWLTLKDGTEQVIVASLMHSAAGQKLREEHGNGVVTTYSYEPETQRLLGIKTERPAGHASGAKVLQDLRYEYDPVGNVLKISNDAEETRFWRNQEVVPENRYTYDSLYQLVSATGREMANAGQQGSSLPSATVPLPTDSSAYTNYTRTYTYDTAGNLTQVSHSPATGSGYTTKITVSDRSNRSVLSTLTENAADVDALFTAGGQQTQLQPGQSLVWTPRNELLKVTPVVRDGATDDQESYRYDGGSQRLLKVSVQKTSSSTQTQRAQYLPGLELRTTKNGDTETESLQVVTVGEAGRAQVRVLHWESGRPDEITGDQIRYSYDNLTGSSQLELDGDGNIISMEEYYPYGGTAVWTARSAVEANYKTVRYSGKERDATGLYYYGYRYYQPWAGRWLSADPAGTVDGLNLFRMVKNNPPSGFDVLGLMWKAVASGAVAAATMGYEVYIHSAPPNSVERTSSSSFGNDRIHALNVKHTEKQNNFSLMEKISKNLSGRGQVLNDLSQGELPAHESINNQKENITALAEFSQTGNLSQLDVKSIIKESVSDAKNNIPTRVFQAVKSFRTVATVDSEGIKELMDTKNIIIDEVKDTAAVGVSIGLAGNAVLTAAKVLVPGAAIPLTVAQAAWAASSVGKIVNETNEVVKTHLEKSDITHKGRTEVLNQIKDINVQNRKKLMNEVKAFIPKME